MRLRTRFSKTFLLFAIAVSVPTAGAQPVLTVHRSIELRVAEAQFVVRGTISHLTRTALEPTPDGEVIYTITVKVDEVIKGPRRPTAEFIAKSRFLRGEFERWAERRVSFLCFGNAQSAETTNNSTLPPLWDAIDLGPRIPGDQGIKGLVDFPPILSMDFACLDDPKEILSRARKFSKEKSTEIHVFEHPPLPAGRLFCFWERLAVPVVPSLETIARRLIKSPEEFVRTRDPALNHLDKASREKMQEGLCQLARADGVAALRHFKSKQNIALLTPLLDNPAFMDFHGPGPDDTKRVYCVRKAAYDVLRKWDVEITKPLIEEPLSSAELFIRQIQTGMTREQVERILGPSRGETSVTKIHYASWYLAKPELDPREFSIDDRALGAVGVVFENGPDGIDTNATAKVREVRYFAERLHRGGGVMPTLVILPENAPEPQQAAARRLAQALNYGIVKRNFTNDPGPETVWFQLAPSGYQVKPWYVIVIDQNVYVRASSYEALDRAVDRLIRSADRIPPVGAPHGARLPRGVMTDYDVIPEE
jgi:hypothetical protein